MLETINYRGTAVEVREVARPDGCACRVLVADDGRAYLEYLDSVGPYKIDLPVVHPLGAEELEAFQSGELDIRELVRTLRGS